MAGPPTQAEPTCGATAEGCEGSCAHHTLHGGKEQLAKSPKNEPQAEARVNLGFITESEVLRVKNRTGTQGHCFTYLWDFGVRLFFFKCAFVLVTVDCIYIQHTAKN